MYIGRWSDDGEEIVPAVVSMCVNVVNIVSIRVAVLWVGSYLVGVVIVVWRSCSIKKLWNWCSGVRLRRLMLMSPTMVISVVDDLVWIVLIVVCRSSMNWSMLLRGRW